MTRFQRWMLRRVFRQEVMQGYWHKENIIELYAMINRAARDEFTEDNRVTLNSFLTECHEASLRKS